MQKMKNQFTISVRKNITRLLGLAVLLLFITGCNTVENKPEIEENLTDETLIEEGSANSLTFDQKTYRMETGLLDDWGENPDEGTRSYAVHVWSEGFGFDENWVLQGEGVVITVFLNSPSLSSLEPGNYTFLESTTAPNSIEYGQIKVFGSDVIIDAGTVALEKSDSTYTITWDVSSKGSEINGNFTGPFPIM
ncbi:MAG: hypothetical protein ACNA8K_15100 [Cyclonatronaceae bacterium]